MKWFIMKEVKLEKEWKTVDFNRDEIIAILRHAPRPLSIKEIGYIMTGNPNVQHLINSRFSGKKNEKWRRTVGITPAYKKGNTTYWRIEA